MSSIIIYQQQQQKNHHQQKKKDKIHISLISFILNVAGFLFFWWLGFFCCLSFRTKDLKCICLCV